MIEFTTEKFSGPLGLLLQLIEGEKLDITEINLAKIADQYVEHLRSITDTDAEEMADFLVIAAKLLFIKSKALLPYLYTEEDEKEIDDLEKQLKMYKEFVLASQKVKDIIALENFLFLPPLLKNRRSQFNLPVFSAPKKITSEILHAALLNLIENLKKVAPEILEERFLEPKINIEEKIFLIRKLLVDKIKVNFSKILRAATNKTEVIVSFLAVLELAKQHELIFDQEELFSEIHIRNNVEENLASVE